METCNFITYEEFGAVGDGIADDAEAIRKAHEKANETDLPVVGLEGKTYRIYDTGSVPIKVRTPFDLSKSTLLIDDTDMPISHPSRTSHIMEIVSDYEDYYLDEQALSRIKAQCPLNGSTQKLDLDLGFPALLTVIDSSKAVYIRYGCDADKGLPQRDIIKVDAEGCIDPATPFLFDYSDVTAVLVHRCDLPQSEYKFGKVISRQCNIPVAPVTKIVDGKEVTRTPGIYYYRSIQVSRPNIHITGLYHVIECEPSDGQVYPSYSGILSMSSTTDILVENCTFRARKSYRICGTYGVGAYSCNNLYFKNCDQSNFRVNTANGPQISIYAGYWGLMGSNFCKNMVYDHCRFTRYDAHSGVYNGKIINSEVSHITLIGGGTMEIENSVIYSRDIINLRPDYGCTFKGVIKIKNCIVNNTERGIGTDVNIVYSHWANHYFGYTTYMPSFEIDNLMTVGKVPVCFLASSDNIYGKSLLNCNSNDNVLEDGTVNENPYVPPHYIKVTNNLAGIEYTVPDIPFFKDTEIVGMKKAPVKK